MFCSVVKESTDVYREMDMNHTFCPAETSVPGRSSSARVFSLFFHAHSDRVMHFFMRILTVLCIFFGEPNRYHVGCNSRFRKQIPMPKKNNSFTYKETTRNSKNLC